MKPQIEICRLDDIAIAVAALEGAGDGVDLLRRAQDMVYLQDVAALACAGGHCWMEMYDVIGRGATLESAIRDWCAAARPLAA